jgi:hypothetical protein
MEAVHTTPDILSCRENHLGECLKIESLNKYTTTIHPPTQIKALMHDAICHQNIIGWENLFCGYIPSYWMRVQLNIPYNERQTQDEPHGTQYTYMQSY